MLAKARFAAAAVVVLVGAMFVIGCGSDDDNGASDATKSGATSVAGQAQGAATSVGGSRGTTDVSLGEKDYSFDMPDTLKGGLVKISAKNSGQQPHQAQIARLNDGVTKDQFDAALKNPDPLAVFKLVTFMGGANTIAPGASQTVYNNLTPGNYAMLCFIEDDDGVPHFAKGMVKMFTVQPGDSGDASAPKASGTVTLADFNFLGDVNSLPAKNTTLEVKNGGPQPHELTVIRLNNGVTVDQLKALLNSDTPPAGPPPIDDAGGLGAMQANQTGFVDLDLKAGQYAFVCFVPDAATGKPHAALGMIKAIEVK